MKSDAPCLEKNNGFAISSGSRHREEATGSTFVRRGPGQTDGPNSSGRMAYALARLRASDEKRSDALARDSRIYTPDPDELTERPCGARR